MQVTLAPGLQADARARRARDILGSCVHCGFCTAVCPTYQLLGDERDGPRGRIWLIKRMLEEEGGGESTRRHLDRCLTCRACEAACPSGVRYGELVEVGRELAAERAPFPWPQRALRAMLVRFLLSPLFGWTVAIASALGALLPEPLARQLPRRVGAARAPAGPLPSGPQGRAVQGAGAQGGARPRVLLLEGCVQPSLRPGIHAAAVRVLRRAGYEPVTAPGAGCCGALRTHAGDHEGGLADLRRNVEAWWPMLCGEDGGAPVEAIVMTASGCGAMVRETGARLAHDPRFADRARIVGERTRDLSDLLPSMLPALRAQLPGAPAAGVPVAAPSVAVHLPCTLQHAQGAGRTLAADLRTLGIDAREPLREGKLCCGSAGTYSVLQPGIARPLRARKLASLGETGAHCIVSANVGCIAHLQSATCAPVRHWVEVVDEMLSSGGCREGRKWEKTMPGGN